MDISKALFFSILILGFASQVTATLIFDPINYRLVP